MISVTATAIAAVAVVFLALNAQIDLGHATANGEHAIARKNRTARKQATTLPVRQAQFRLVERVLTIDPTGDPVANKRCVNRVVETLLRRCVFTEEGHGELRAVAIEQGDGVVQILSLIHI